MTPLAICVAALLHLPPPDPLPAVTTWSQPMIAAATGKPGSTGASFPGLIVYAEGHPDSRLVIAHELAHEIQRQNGIDPKTKSSENQAQWIERRVYAGWCSQSERNPL